MAGLRSLFRLATGRSRVEADVADELELHRALAEEELLRAGVAPDEAARRASAELGDRGSLARQVAAIDRVGERRVRIREWLGRWSRDVRMALRGFRHDPWFSAVALVVVALGVGANVAVFGILNAAFFHPLPYRDVDRIVSVVETNQGAPMQVAGANLKDWQQGATDFAQLAGYQTWGRVLTGRGTPETVLAAVASRSLSSVVGIDPMLGRWFSADEAVGGAAPVAVLSERLWRDRFGADPNVLGSTFRIDGISATVIGVMPQTMDFPVGAQLWLPIEPMLEGVQSRSAHNWRVVGRLRNGVTVEAATRSLSALTRQIVAGEPQTRFVADGARVTPIREMLLGQSPRVLQLLQGAVGLLLLVAVLNLTALLLARATKRQNELVMIRTMGATRSDLIRRFVVESLLLTAVGAAIGLLAWFALRPTLLGAVESLLPFVRSVPVDLAFVAFVVGLVVGVGLLAGVLPALWAARSVERGTAERVSNRIVGPSRALQTLVGIEVAATFVLLAGAGLLSSSLARMLDQSLGFETTDRLVIPLPLPSDAGTPYADLDRRQQLFDAVREQLAALPGVTSVALTTAVPMGSGSPNGGVGIQGYPDAADGSGAIAEYRVAGPGFFATLGTPPVAGRDFTADDRTSSPPVAIVNEAFVRAYLTPGDPIGRQVRMPGMEQRSDSRWAEIVGVVADVRHDGPGTTAAAAVYFPLAQRPQYRLVSAVVTIRGAPAPILNAARDVLARLEPEMPFGGAPYSSLLGNALSNAKLRTVGLGAFAAAALILATVGLFGVVGFIVLGRTREIGVRLALGASRASVASGAFGHALRPVMVGLVVGGLLVPLLGGLVRGFLFEVGVADPITMVGAAALVLLATAVACLGPIRRALAVDPATVLRSGDAR
ncbi:MAG: ADOP family duplicated permease [Gemmatimonadales bacterium]